MGNKYFYRDRLTIFNFFFSLSLFNLFPRWSIDDDKYNNLSDPLYIFQWKISEYSKRPIFDRFINFKTPFFKQALSISSFFGKIAHASMDKGHLSRSFNPCKSIFIHDRCTFVHSATVVPLTFTNPPPFLPSLPPVLSLSSVPSLSPTLDMLMFSNRIFSLVNLPVHLR